MYWRIYVCMYAHGGDVMWLWLWWVSRQSTTHTIRYISLNVMALGCIINRIQLNDPFISLFPRAGDIHCLCSHTDPIKGCCCRTVQLVHNEHSLIKHLPNNGNSHGVYPLISDMRAEDGNRGLCVSTHDLWQQYAKETGNPLHAPHQSPVWWMDQPKLPWQCQTRGYIHAH